MRLLCRVQMQEVLLAAGRQLSLQIRDFLTRHMRRKVINPMAHKVVLDFVQRRKEARARALRDGGGTSMAASAPNTLHATRTPARSTLMAGAADLSTLSSVKIAKRAPAASPAPVGPPMATPTTTAVAPNNGQAVPAMHDQDTVDGARKHKRRAVRAVVEADDDDNADDVAAGVVNGDSIVVPLVRKRNTSPDAAPDEVIVAVPAPAPENTRQTKRRRRLSAGVDSEEEDVVVPCDAARGVSDSASQDRMSEPDVPRALPTPLPLASAQRTQLTAAAKAMVEGLTREDAVLLLRAWRERRDAMGADDVMNAAQRKWFHTALRGLVVDVLAYADVAGACTVVEMVT